MLFSVLIPVRNDLKNLRQCLAALALLDHHGWELLVCDDGSLPELNVHQLRYIVPQVRLFRTEPKGPASARNFLARQASGKYLFFLDADVQVLPDTLTAASRIASNNPELKAFFGSYDSSPADKGLVSRYKNLLHHQTHQNSAGRVASFWCGCGVIDRNVFLTNGGFLESFAVPSVEDIELGQRLSAAGVEIRCFPEVQVKHLKRWAFGEWIQTDLCRRGIPWMRIMTQTGRWQSQLNFSWSQRVAGLAALGLLGSLIFSFWWVPLLAVTLACLCSFLALNRRFFALLLKSEGGTRTCLSVGLHLIYSYVCVLSLLVGFAAGILSRFRTRLDDEDRPVHVKR